MRRARVLRKVLVVGTVALASLVLAGGTARAAGQSYGVCGTSTVANGSAGPSGLRLSAHVFGGTLTLTAAPGIFSQVTPVGICTSPGPFRGPVVAYFGIGVETATVPGAIHVVLTGPGIAPGDVLQLQGGPQFLERNIVFTGGSVRFDAYQYLAYAVLANHTVAASTGPWRVSTISSSLLTPAQAVRPLQTVLVDLAVAAMATLLITFPAQLFNSTFEENYPEIRAWWERRTSPLTRRRRPEDTRRRVLSARPVAAGTVLLVGGLLASLNDPHFGWHRSSALTYLAVVPAMIVTVSVPAISAAVYHRLRFRSLGARINALPAGLVIAAGCVLVSRLTGFQPGYLYGVVLGVVFSRRLARHEAGHVAVLTSLATLAVAVAAWVAWASITSDSSRPGASFGLVLVADMLAAVFVAGLVGTVIGLLPLRFLPGAKLREWRPLVWAAVFALAVFGLVQILLRPHGHTPAHAPIVVTVTLFVVFGAGSVAFWDHFDRKHRRQHGETVPPIHKRLRELAVRATPRRPVGS